MIAFYNMTLSSIVHTTPRAIITLKFIDDETTSQSAKPYHISGILPDNLEVARTNVQYQELHNSSLFNLRGSEHKLSLAKHGFQILEIPDEIANLDIKGPQKVEYMEHMTNIIKDLLGASHAICYDCRVSDCHPVSTQVLQLISVTTVSVESQWRIVSAGYGGWVGGTA